MARIKGIDLPKNKGGVIGLTYIYGIGPSFAKDILTKEKLKTKRDKKKKLYIYTNKKSLFRKYKVTIMQ